MNTLEGLVWFSIALFMLHEFEEIIMLKAWAVRYREKILTLWPKGKPFGLHFFDEAGYAASPVTETASIGIFMQFILNVLLVLFSVLFNNYLIWFAFTVLSPVTSLFLHVRVSLQFKGYSPGLITAILTAAPTVWILCRVYSMTDYGVWQIVIASVAVNLVTAFLAMKYMHKSASALAARLQKYADAKQE